MYSTFVRVILQHIYVFGVSVFGAMQIVQRLTQHLTQPLTTNTNQTPTPFALRNLHCAEYR